MSNKKIEEIKNKIVEIDNKIKRLLLARKTLVDALKELRKHG